MAAGCCSELWAVTESIAGWMCVGFLCQREKRVVLVRVVCRTDWYSTNRQSYKYSPLCNDVCHCCVVVRQVYSDTCHCCMVTSHCYAVTHVTCMVTSHCCAVTHHFIFDIYFCSPFARPTCWVETIGGCEIFLGVFIVRVDMPLYCAVLLCDCY
jgi:hypothetical protein